MEIYIIVFDSWYRRMLVIDRYESLIWTERFSAWGDFELKLHSNHENRSRLPVGTILHIVESYRLMIIETVEDTVDQEGKEILIVRGRSLESILESRLARSTMGDLTTTPKWSITDEPAEIARKLFTDVCVTGVVNSGDIIPEIIDARPPSIYPDDTILEPTDTITYEIDPITLYKAIKDICDIYMMGFRLSRHPYNNALYWDVYMGCDRTTQQTDLPAVVFSTGLNNLSNARELSSTALYKNVAYVLSPVGSETVYPDDVDPGIEGFNRKVLFVVADDITSGVPATATAQMIQRGKEELAKNRRIAAFDGEVNSNSQYLYLRDYNLGDLVEFQNDDGVSSIMQVTEHIFVSDREGIRSFPTLTINSFIVPGSIDDSPPDLLIDDVDPDLVIDDA